MFDRWSWTRAGFLAVSSIALAALAWSLNGAEEKCRDQRRKREVYEDKDTAPSHAASSRESRSALKGGRDGASEETSLGGGKAVGSDARPLTASAQQRAQRQATSGRQGSATAVAQQLPLAGGSGSAWIMPRSPTSPSWPGAGGLTPRRWQAGMSASEKRELDLMFRHQERHEGRSPHAVVDLSKAKAKRSKRHRREEIRPADSINDVAFAPEEDPDLLAKELLAEEAANRKSIPREDGKKTKKKPRRRNKTKSDVGKVAVEPSVFEDADEVVSVSRGDDAEASAIQCVSRDLPSGLEFFVSCHNEMVEGDYFAEEVEDQGDEIIEALPPVVEPEEGVMDKVCDAVVETCVPAGTPTTEDPSLTGASSRQASEMGDEALVAALSEAAAEVTASTSAGASTGSSGSSREVEVQEAPQEFEHQLKSTIKSARRSRHRAWADLEDTSDGEFSGAWAIGAAPAPIAVDSPSSSDAAALPAASASGSTSTSEVVATLEAVVCAGASKALDEIPSASSTGTSEVAKDTPLLSCPVEDVVPVSLHEAQHHEACDDVAELARQQLREADTKLLKAAQQHSWVTVQTRTRARKAAKF